MRTMKRIPLLPILAVALAGSLAGCYTMLRHPDISDQYELEDEQEAAVVAHCGECHTVAYRPSFLLMPPVDESAQAPAPLRSIDPSTPVRAPESGIGPTIPTVTGAGETAKEKTVDASRETDATSTKKIVPDGKTPVKSGAEEAPKGSGDDKKTADTKKERP